MTEELTPLPCPFCGGSIVEPLFTYYAQCSNCGCEGPYQRGGTSPTMPAEAIAAWNRRAQPEPAASACRICAETEPHTGACGSNDPRALCNAPAAPSVAPESAPVAYKVWHREAKHCFCLASELPTEFRSDTGEPDGYFGGKVQPLFAHPPRAPLTDAQLRAVYANSAKNHQTWEQFARAIEAAHGIRGQG